MSKRPELEIMNGDLAGKRYEVGAGGLRLGRSSSNDVHIPDEELSRNHCLFERVGDSDIRVTDLASANGTYLNGEVLKNDPVLLKVGDVINVGVTTIKVVGEEPAKPVAVDLGLGERKVANSAKKRSPIANLLWVVAILIAGAAAYLAMTVKLPNSVEAPAAIPEEDNPQLAEMNYEFVDANSEGIFRYSLNLNADGVLTVAVDDVPKEDRHLTKAQPLDDAAKAELADILAFKTLREIDREYVGVEPDPPALKSWHLRVVYSSRVRSIRIVNTAEPEAFKVLREKLEAFSKNQLGVWALQYSREKLIELAKDSLTIGREKYADREVKFGNLFAAVSAFQEALFYLETVNPKPECFEEARKGLEQAKKELDQRYADQRFLADRAINLSQWETAQNELRTLLEMIPDRNDDRNREAKAKLVDVEKRLKGGM